MSRPAAVRRGGSGVTLLELVAVMAVVAVAAGLVLARVPYGGALELERAGRALAERLSATRERAILQGRSLAVRVAEHLPPTVRLESLDVGGMAVGADALELAPDGDALPARAVLADERGARVHVVLPAGFHRARIERAP
jgi:prepilin-type N-terminal cleavage/methylation domain-containing protein